MTITVFGQPAPQGSKRFVGHAKNGRGIMIESSAKVKPWREAVKWAAVGAETRWNEAVTVHMTFSFLRPKSAKKRHGHTVKPDLSKLVRSTEDALTDAGVWRDDSLVTCCIARKLYVGDVGALDSPGAVISIELA